MKPGIDNLKICHPNNQSNTPPSIRYFPVSIDYTRCLQITTCSLHLHGPMKAYIGFISISLNYVTQTCNRTSFPLSLTRTTIDRKHIMLFTNNNLCCHLIIIIIISGSTVLVRALAASQQRFCNLIKTPVGLLWMSDQPITKASTYTGHNTETQRAGFESQGMDHQYPLYRRLGGHQSQSGHRG
jgi:hypothetical protein